MTHRRGGVVGYRVGRPDLSGCSARLRAAPEGVVAALEDVRVEGPSDMEEW
ncbi:hypothetical protein SAMN05421630_103539 [Prauserella marina]|uniref:Uncharacterized protein n=1 Tax=Prauserella marina TaxID=530584 RepID=A0A1G6PAM9_9PSEU|nr:hypothetical protein [Prauserella marina]PWV82756.1 hypothetical protein DES30_1021003 [Prauserella marina]SDC76546.1 hypothetical protein SAMN05421630_103539 [Prauserella marina]